MHLQKFAGEGLRTLVLAERVLDGEFFRVWRARQQEAALSLDGREDKLGAIYEEIECDLTLIGVTAIEDKLQDGVPQTIANLQMAGIKIWVLTGDKQETAVNIGYSCQLLTDDLLDLFVVDGSTQDEVEQQLRKFKESIKIVSTYSPGKMIWLCKTLFIGLIFYCQIYSRTRGSGYRRECRWCWLLQQ